MAVQHMEINQCTLPHNCSKGKKPHIIISIDAEKGFDKIKYFFLIKTKKIRKLGRKINFYKRIKGNFSKSVADMTTAFNTVLEVLTRAN